MQWCCRWGDPCFSSATESSCSRPVHRTDIIWAKNRSHLMLLKRTFQLFPRGYLIIHSYNFWIISPEQVCSLQDVCQKTSVLTKKGTWLLLPKSQTMMQKGFTHNSHLPKQSQSINHHREQKSVTGPLCTHTDRLSFRWVCPQQMQSLLTQLTLPA